MGCISDSCSIISKEINSNFHPNSRAKTNGSTQNESTEAHKYIQPKKNSLEQENYNLNQGYQSIQPVNNDRAINPANQIKVIKGNEKEKKNKLKKKLDKKENEKHKDKDKDKDKAKDKDKEKDKDKDKDKDKNMEIAKKNSINKEQPIIATEPIINSPILIQNRNDNIQGLSDYIIQSLRIHNELRSKHLAPSLTINHELNQIAQNYANILAQTNTFKHSGNTFHGNPLGENLYKCIGVQLTGTKMTQAWYNEIKDWDFNKAEFTPGTGHFTQLIWANSREVGFGIAQAEDGWYYGVANYYPAGNYKKQFAVNVIKP